MRRRIGLRLGTAALFCAVGCAFHGADHSARRTTQVAVAGATVLRLDVGGGYLRVEGSPGATSVTISGIARASSRQLLHAVELATSRTGDTILVSCLIPPPLEKSSGSASLDVELTVPATLALEVIDSSGEAAFHGTGPITIVHGDGGLAIDSATGNLDIRNGSGDMVLGNVAGNIRIVDGAGSIYVTNITGSVVVPEAGAGELEAVNISGDLAIGSKRSGEIAARGVGGNLSVTASGSGSIEYRDVAGRVAVPMAGHH